MSVAEPRERKRSLVESQIKRAAIIQGRIAGKTLETIASEVGLTHEGVRYHQLRWLEQQRPSSEATEELRQTQAATIDAMHAKLWPRLDSDDYLLVTDRLVKLMDRKARLMGLDLERNVTVNVFTAEQMYEALFAPQGVVEGRVVELEAPDA